MQSNHTEISLAKRLLRRQMLDKRKELSNCDLTAGSSAICERLTAFSLFAQANTIMAYLAMPGEPQLDQLLRQAIAAGKTVCVPLMGSVYGIMEAAVISDFNDLVLGRLGVRMPNPASAQLVSANAIDLALIPGVAFDASGGRLGMGAGYYDRFLLQATKAIRVGVAWSMQLVERVPREDHDMLMHWVVTEKEVVCCEA